MASNRSGLAAGLLCGAMVVSAGTASGQTVVAAAGLPTPEGDAEFVGFEGLLSLNDAGQLAFKAAARFAGPPTQTVRGIWTGLPPAMSRLVLQNEAPPGLPPGASFSLLFNPVVDDTGRTWFYALFTRPDFTRSQGLWTGIPGNLQLVLAGGDPAPGLPAGVSVRTFTAEIRTTGLVAVRAFLEGTGIDASNDEAIYLGSSTGLTIVAQEGDPAPGLAPGVTLGELFVVDINALGDFAMTAGLAGAGVDGSNNNALYIARPGDLQLVWRKGDAAPGLADAIMDDEISTIRLNDARQLAFRADLDNRTSPALRQGLFAGSPGSLQPVVLATSVSRIIINNLGEVAGSAFTGNFVGTPGIVEFLPAGLSVSQLLDDGLMVLSIGTPPPAQSRSLLVGRTTAALTTFLTTDVPLVPGLEFVDFDVLANRTGRVALFGVDAFRNRNVVAIVDGLPVALDGDGDGIDAEIDGRFVGSFIDDSSIASDDFTDEHLGGTTFGTISDRADLAVTVRDAAGAARGVLAAAGPGVGPAVLDACELPAVQVILSPGDSADITCGSLSLQSIVGAIELLVGSDVALTVPEGAALRIADLGPATFEVRHTGRVGAIRIDEAGTPRDLLPGEQTTVEATVATNQPPSAEAGPDAVVECSGAQTPVVLDGSGSSDPDGDALAFEWLDGAGAVVATSASFSIPLGSGQHTFTLTVDDGSATDSDGVSVTVVDTVPPAVSVTTPVVTSEAVDAVATPVDVVVAAGFAATDACDAELAVQVVPAGPYPFGATSVTVIAEDDAGNSASALVTVRVVDTTPPSLSVPEDVTAIAEGAQTALDIGSATASDIFEPVAISNDAPADGFPVGTSTVTWTATDANGNTAAAPQRVHVRYQFGGFLPPLRPGGAFAIGRTVPVKIRALFANGALVPDVQATLSVQLVVEGVPTGVPLAVDSSCDAEQGETFRRTGDHYRCRLRTRGLTPGTYRLLVDLHDGAEPSLIDVELRRPPSGSGRDDDDDDDDDSEDADTRAR